MQFLLSRLLSLIKACLGFRREDNHVDILRKRRGETLFLLFCFGILLTSYEKRILVKISCSCYPLECFN